MRQLYRVTFLHFRAYSEPGAVAAVLGVDYLQERPAVTAIPGRSSSG